MKRTASGGTSSLSPKQKKGKSLITGMPPLVGAGPVRPRRTAVEACEQDAWHLKVWRRDAPERAKRFPFRCGSWRHEGPCREYRARVDASRIYRALVRDITLYGATAAIWGVFTLRPSEFPSQLDAFEHLWRGWQSVRQAVVRNFGPVVGHVSTVEVHRSKWPHMNIIMVCPDLGAALARDPKKTLKWWSKRADSCGFGPRASLEHIRMPERVARYIAKADIADDCENDSQVPVNAPRGFRRLRSSKGWLPPPPEKDPTWTGELVKRPMKLGEG